MDARTPPWAGRKVLVTGCTGFLGGAVGRELLAAGAGVVGLVRDRTAGAEFARQTTGRAWAVHGRVEDGFRIASALAVHEVGAVFHLAASSPNHPDRGAAAVVEAVRRYDPRVPVVVARPSEETPPPNPLPRGRGLGGGVSVSPPIPLGIARFGELFGPGDPSPGGIVPATIRGLLSGLFRSPADDTPRDFVPVPDAARACLRLAEHLLERPDPRLADHTFRSGWAFSDRAMATAVREALAGRPVPTAGPTPRNPFGWSPVTSFADALAETVAWYRESSDTSRPSDVPCRAAA